MATKFDANGMIVHPKDWVSAKGLCFGPTTGRNGLSLTIFGEQRVFHFSFSLWFDRFWASPTLSLHWSSGRDYEIRHKHIRF